MFGSRKLYKNKRNSFLEIEVLPKISLFSEKPFHIWFAKCFHLAGFVTFNVFFLIYLLSIIFLMLHYLVFKVQFKEYEFFWFQYEFMQIVNFLRRRRVLVYARPRKNSLDAWSCAKLVEMRRIELLTPCLQGRCSPSWATPPFSWLHSLFKSWWA